jgi:hypothetical protein
MKTVEVGTVRANRLWMVMALIIASLLSPCACVGNTGDGFVLEPNFTIEDGGYRETVIFVSGLSYAISRFERDHAGRHVKPSYCMQGKPITSKLVIDLLNETLDGSVSSEMATELLFIQLSNHFPCGE